MYDIFSEFIYCFEPIILRIKLNNGMAILPRSEIIQPGNMVRLTVTFRGSDGLPADTDAFPSFTIVAPSGLVVIGPTSAGVSRTGVGNYEFIFDVGLQPSVGVWNDIWQGTIGGNVEIQEKSFTVFTSQMPALNSDGYEHLGDDPGFNYSQTAIHNINHLLKLLRARLKSRGLHKTIDEFGNPVFTDCDIYTIDELVSFIAWALCTFNEVPTFTFITFDDTPMIEQFCGILVQGAALVALSSQALIERSREFVITDNGIGFTPPTVSELLNNQFNTELQNWYDRLKYIKMNLRPEVLGLGVFSMSSGSSPAMRRLRWLKQRRIV